MVLPLEADGATLCGCLLISIGVRAHSAPNSCGSGEPSLEAQGRQEAWLGFVAHCLPALPSPAPRTEVGKAGSSGAPGWTGRLGSRPRLPPLPPPPPVSSRPSG